MGSSRVRSVTKIDQVLPELYFREVAETFDEALANVGCSEEMFLELAGLRICIKSASKQLLPRISPALMHRKIPRPDSVDFTINCWDDASAGVEAPMPAGWMRALSPSCCITVLTNTRFRALYMSWVETLACIDLESRVAYCCYADAEQLLMYEISGPLRSVFNTILNEKEMQLIHAAAIGTPRGSILFGGPPRAGKSTLAVQCLQSGLSYQSDDLCVLTSGSQPRSLSLYNIAKVREDALPRFKSLHPILTHFQETGERKAYFLVHQHFPKRVLKEAPVRALILPKIGNTSRSCLERIAPVEAVHAVVSWTIREVPRSDHVGEKIMLQAVSRLPTHRLHLGSNEEETLDLIRNLLDER